jgi:hypothetical protein
LVGAARHDEILEQKKKKKLTPLLLFKSPDLLLSC